MNTQFMLMAQYNGKAIIPLQDVVQDYFPHLSPESFIKKASMGDIEIPVVRVDPTSQKSAKGIYLADLAKHIDLRRAAALKEAAQLRG